MEWSCLTFQSLRLLIQGQSKMYTHLNWVTTTAPGTLHCVRILEVEAKWKQISTRSSCRRLLRLLRSRLGSRDDRPCRLAEMRGPCRLVCHCPRRSWVFWQDQIMADLRQTFDSWSHSFCDCLSLLFLCLNRSLLMKLPFAAFAQAKLFLMLVARSSVACRQFKARYLRAVVS